jgi:hypothetical protein
MDITTEFENRSAKRGGKEGEEKESACGARNLKPPFPGYRVYGTDPRSQGYVVIEILQRRENLYNHRFAPLTAPVPFPKTAWISGKGGKCKAPGSRLAPALMPGQTAASKVQGLRPCDPARKKPEIIP